MINCTKRATGIINDDFISRNKVWHEEKATNLPYGATDIIKNDFIPIACLMRAKVYMWCLPCVEGHLVCSLAESTRDCSALGCELSVS